jgi:hypothetical protein
MALRIPGKGVSAAHIPYCFIQNAKPCSLSANWGRTEYLAKIQGRGEHAGKWGCAQAEPAPIST